ncbi:intestinal mucin-like protein [Chiloscyllium punctatum]|uniref:intestinal mucin-like protein n=1 Tax=Chiloscyllium punctatum TaxID=137246 RepID=UPI003B63887C
MDYYPPERPIIYYPPEKLHYNHSSECFVNGKYLKIGESIQLEVYNCTKVIGTCIYKDHQCLLTKTTLIKSCTEPGPDENCIPLGYDANGCCKTYHCKPMCSITTSTATLRKNDCKVDVVLNHCKGRCSSETIYNGVTGLIETHCGCCMPKKFKKLTAKATCKNGQMILLEYLLFQECECNYDMCKPVQ